MIERPTRCIILMLIVGALSVFNHTAVGKEVAMHDPSEEQAAVPYNPDEEGISRVEQVLRQQESRLMAKPGVTGVGIARSPTGDPAIVIYLEDHSFRKGLPTLIDGHPVVTQVTGPIEAQRR